MGPVPVIDPAATRNRQSSIMFGTSASSVMVLAARR